MSENNNTLKQIIEGLLLAAGKPLSISAIAEVFLEDQRPSDEEFREALAQIALDCEGRGFELKEVASGFRFQVRQELSEWISRLWEEKPQRYTRAMLETLALIAYRQPITRGDIEEIRGVSVSSTIVRTLLDREWVRVVGHRDVPGRPAMFATTRQFLDYFNLKSLQDLPPLSEIRDLDKLNPELALEDDDLASMRVLDLPSEVEERDDDDEIIIGHEEQDEQDLIDETEAIALAKRPLDEILGVGQFDKKVDEDESSEEEGSDEDDASSIDKE